MHVKTLGLVVNLRLCFFLLFLLSNVLLRVLWHSLEVNAAITNLNLILLMVVRVTIIGLIVFVDCICVICLGLLLANSVNKVEFGGLNLLLHSHLAYLI